MKLLTIVFIGLVLLVSAGLYGCGEADESMPPLEEEEIEEHLEEMEEHYEGMEH